MSIKTRAPKPTKARRSSQSKPPDLEKVFNAVSGRRIGNSVCFLCGKKLTSVTRSDEHVLSGWLQNSFNLWNQHLILLNGTSIPYRSLKIPCCKKCNNVHLGRIDKAVQLAVSGGPEAVRSLNKTDLLIWLSKILYGLVYREHLLNFDRSNPLKGKIVRRSFLKRFEMFHFFLQAARVPMQFVNFFPASIFVFRTQVPSDHRVQFDLADSPFCLTIGLRMGSMGIVAALQDGGAQSTIFEKYMKKFKKLELHPIQFTELLTKVFYKACLLNRVPKYLIVKQLGTILVHQMPLGGLSAKPIYDEWNWETYARTLAHRTSQPMDKIYYPPDKCWTWLEDKQGKVIFMDIKKDSATTAERIEIMDLLSKRARPIK